MRNTLKTSINSIWIKVAGSFPFLVPKKRGSIHHYLLVIVLMALALWVRLAIEPVTAGLQYLTFFPAVALAAIAGGYRAGLFAVIIGIAFATCIFTPPYYSFSVEVFRSSFWSNTVFLMDGIIVSFSIEAMHRYRQKYALELKQSIEAHEALRESTLHIKKILDNLFSYVALLDINGVIQEVNQAPLARAGLSRESVIGQYFYDAPWWSYDEKVQSQLKQAIEVAREGQLLRYDVTVKMGDELVPIDFQISPVHDEQGRVIGLLPTAVDITERKAAEQAMKDQQARLNALVEAAMDAIVSTDENQKIIIFNHGAEQMFGHRAADIIGQHLDLLIPIRYRKTHCKHVDEYGKTGISSRTMNALGQTCGLRANGDEFPFEATISRVTVGGGQIYTAILRDITLRKLSEVELRIAAVAIESQEGMMITDAKGVILRVNHAFTETTGYSAEEAIGKTPSLLRSGRHNADFYRDMWETLNRTGVWQGEIWDRRKNGEIYPKWLTITAVRGDDGVVTHFVGSHIDITERKVSEEKIKNLAFYDPLTRLPNRRLLLDRLQQTLASSARTGRGGALLFIDLDKFKILNDTLGHDIGDLLLQNVAQRLEACVREGDTVARLGGDEFVIMLEDLSDRATEAAEQTEAVGEKILASLNQPYQLASHEYHSTPSIGVTLFNDHKLGIDELLKQADIAMYQAKQAGRNALRFFDPQMQDTINARASLEGDLRKAIEKQQFQLYYQIQVDAANCPVGAEALIRWNHPERGMVSPVQFIPLAEEAGLILSIGQWVLETACAQLKTWQQDDRTHDLVLAVNVSAKQFRQADFVAQVLATIQRHAINPAGLKLEITESMLFENIEEIITSMKILKEAGVRFSLDDFGTGYSSLQYLKRLPLNQLKIDQSFVRDIVSESNARAIVRTIIAMAHNLGLEVIAEGVETEGQREVLLSSRCTHYQGYLFGKPVPIELFEKKFGQG